MNRHDETKRAIESSKVRREKRLDALLRDTKIKAAVHRDQHPQRNENKSREEKIQVTDEAAVISIGYDDVEDWSYSLLMSFDIMEGGDHEFFFCLVRVDNHDGSEVRYWSGLEVSKFASSDQRARIRRGLLQGLQRLLKRLAPQRVFCCTHDENPPDNALRKHFLIAETFEKCGYEVTRMPVYVGQHSWWMEKPAPQLLY
jgi:hypothetical protein